VPETSPAVPIQTGDAVSFRLPKPTYLVIAFLVVGVTPLALYGGPDNPLNATISAWTLIYLIPILATFFIARSATLVDAHGITVSALFGSRTLRWDELRGLSVTGRNVYAVTSDGSVRLPCVRHTDLTAIAAASGTRLPELPAQPPKYAPKPRRR